MDFEELIAIPWSDLFVFEGPIRSKINDNSELKAFHR